MQLEFFMLDRDTINGHAAHADAVGMEDVRRAIAEHYPIDKMAFVVIGQA